MSTRPPDRRDRLLELLADEHLGQLTPEDRAELESLRAALPTESIEVLPGALLVALDKATAGEAELPASLREKLVAQGLALSAPASLPMSTPAARGGNAGGASGGTGRLWALAAGLAVAATAAIITGAAWMSERRQRLEASAGLDSARLELAALQRRIEDNDRLLADARTSAEALRARLATAGANADEQARRAADAEQRALSLAAQLAEATSNLDRARLEIAKFNEPVDPATLAQNRRKLLEVPGTVRVAWAPFDLPDNPAELREVKGDVAWNDDLQQGYLRFEGLKVNDPAVEQYQVWVIDERGLEQKVSGGVFNADAQGEIIVPIKPGIDVGRVALFAVTIEKPGGIWVPDLKRRVVIAPRDG